MIDILSTVDDEFLSGMELSEEEVYLLSGQLNQERIKEKARQGIVKGTVRQTVRMRPRKMTKWAVGVILAAVLLGGSVAVAHNLDAFRFYLGAKAVIPDEEITDVSKSVSAYGVKMTVDSVIAGENDFVTLLTFELEDGSAFPEGAEFYDINLCMEGNGMNMAVSSARLTEDRKQIVSLIESSSGESLLGREITAKSLGLYTEASRDVNSDISLQECFQQNPTRMEITDSIRDTPWDITLYPDFEQQLIRQLSSFQADLPLKETYPGFGFGGVGIIDGKLNIALYFPAGDEHDPLNELRSEAVIKQLIDSRTVEIHQGSYRVGLPSAIQGMSLNISEFEELDEEDLPYLTPVVTYITRDILAKGPWEITFTVKDQGKNITVSPDMTINVGGEEAVLTEANISLVGGYVVGEWRNRQEPGLPEGYAASLRAVTKDGKMLRFKISAASCFTNQEGDPCFKFNYEIFEDEQKKNRIFLSGDKLAEIKKIIVDDHEFQIN
ncbi:MAG: hypothetical protein K0Q48_2561 [Bacillota bacterium]|nr:hypothetical protein [Bacillota bacterium]